MANAREQRKRDLERMMRTDGGQERLHLLHRQTTGVDPDRSGPASITTGEMIERILDVEFPPEQPTRRTAE